MKEWTAIVVAQPETESSPILSRLPSYLHPVAGRPLIWHTVNSIVGHGPDPAIVVVLAPPELTVDLFEGIGADVRVFTIDSASGRLPALPDLPDQPILLVHGGACFDRGSLSRLAGAAPGSWAAGGETRAAGILIDPVDVHGLLQLDDPFRAANLPSNLLLSDTQGTFVVETRPQLARAHQRVRDHLVRTLMDGGVTFILPESNLVDVDVRIGRDTLVYPGVILEGQTTVGDETVIGPSCRIIDSWIGSGVELKGWNYIAHTSVRNRAILEPYVRRGFD